MYPPLVEAMEEAGLQKVETYHIWSMINVQGFSGFRRQLARTKIYKAQRKQANITAYIIYTGFGPAYARINRSGVNFVLLFLSTIYHTSSQFVPTSLFASATATNRVRRH